MEKLSLSVWAADRKDIILLSIPSVNRFDHEACGIAHVVGPIQTPFPHFKNKFAVYATLASSVAVAVMQPVVIVVVVIVLLLLLLLLLGAGEGEVDLQRHPEVILLLKSNKNALLLLIKQL